MGAVSTEIHACRAQETQIQEAVDILNPPAAPELGTGDGAASDAAAKDSARQSISSDGSGRGGSDASEEQGSGLVEGDGGGGVVNAGASAGEGGESSVAVISVRGHQISVTANPVASAAAAPLSLSADL
eukprot:SAG25_NODE_117_length_14819_cov_20.935670_6_plen_129_part_00